MLEARVGIEPTCKGFADPLITAPNLADSTAHSSQVPFLSAFCPPKWQTPAESTIRAVRSTTNWNWRGNFIGDDEEGTPIRLKAEKGLKQRSREQCKAQTKAGGGCQAPWSEGCAS